MTTASVTTSARPSVRGPSHYPRQTPLAPPILTSLRLRLETGLSFIYPAPWWISTGEALRVQAISKGHLAVSFTDSIAIDSAQFADYRSPRDRCVFPARKGACRAIRAKECNAHYLAGALLDGLGALIPVEVRLGETRGNEVDLNPGCLQLDHHTQRDRVEGCLGRRIHRTEKPMVAGVGVRIRRQRAEPARHIDDAGI